MWQALDLDNIVIHREWSGLVVGTKVGTVIRQLKARKIEEREELKMETAVASNVVPLTRKPQHAKRSSLVFLTPDEVRSVLRTARARSIRDWAIILLAYRHGLRASEVCNLLLDDIDLKNRSITIARLKGSMKTVQPLYEHRGQPLLDEVRAIRQWLPERREDGSGFLFLSQKGSRLDRSQFFRIFQAVAVAAGLPAEKTHPHVLKHSLASHLVAGNVNLALIKQAMGHRSISSTMQYIGTTDGQAADAVQAALMGIF
jgi:type 1 fimbriae regulatory protein FimB